jgi:ADP-ribose pyrophosphatase
MAKNDNKTEKLLMRKYVFEGKMLKLRVDTVLSPDGRRSTREIIERSDCVAVIAVDADDNVLLVNQYRTPLSKQLLEVPAGGIEKGENAEKAVTREMQEETGFRPAKVIRLCGGYLSPGYSSEYCSIYLAMGLTHDPLSADDTASIELVKMPVGQVLDAIATGKIQDSKSIAGLLYYLEWKKNNLSNTVQEFNEPKPEGGDVLKKEWTNYRELPFPHNPKDARLADLFADLVLEDGEIAGIVTQFLQGKKVDKNRVYINEELNKKLQAFEPADDSGQIARRELIEYKSRLDKLIQLVLAQYDK